MREAKTRTFTSLIGTYCDGVPAGGTGLDVKCLQTKGEDKKSCCTSRLAKQTSMSEMSARGTIPTAEFGSCEMISRAHTCLYAAGRGMKAECREEEGGRRCGAANCSRLTAHSVGRNAGVVFLAATCAQVSCAAIVQLTTEKLSLCRSVECVD